MLFSLNLLANWTEGNLMKLDEQKCTYMVFSRSESKFATKLKNNNTNINRIKLTKILGGWVSEDLSLGKTAKIFVSSPTLGFEKDYSWRNVYTICQHWKCVVQKSCIPEDRPYG